MPKFINHKWDAFGEVCERCKLKRRIKVYGDGFVHFNGNRYEYHVDGTWTSERPGCHDNKKSNRTISKKYFQ